MQEWIEQEFSSCDLGDRRLDDRLKTIISRISQDPSRSLSSACRGFAEVVACRRFFDNEVVSQSQLLAPHREASLERIKQHPKVLFIQDTTELDFTTKKKLQGTGPLSSPHRRGFFAHNELVVSPERLPLGLWETSIECGHECKCPNCRPPSGRKHPKPALSLAPSKTPSSSLSGKVKIGSL